MKPYIFCGNRIYWYPNRKIAAKITLNTNQLCDTTKRNYLFYSTDTSKLYHFFNLLLNLIQRQEGLLSNCHFYDE